MCEFATSVEKLVDALRYVSASIQLWRKAKLAYPDRNIETVTQVNPLQTA